MEVDGVREGVVLLLPADQFDHHGTDPGFVHDSVVDGPTPASDGFLRAGLAKRSRTIQSFKEFSSGLKALVDLHHQLFSGPVEVADSLEFDGIMVGIGITVDELNVQAAQERFNPPHDLGKFMESLSHLAGSETFPHGTDFFGDISEFGTGRKELRAVGDMNLEALRIGVVDDDPLKLDLVVARIRKLDKDDRVDLRDRPPELDRDEASPRVEIELNGLVSFPVEQSMRIYGECCQEVGRNQGGVEALLELNGKPVHSPEGRDLFPQGLHYLIRDRNHVCR